MRARVPALSTPAIVLRAVNYGEADRVVTLFGREIGRVSALARSARKSQRRFAGGLGLGAVGVAALRERPGAEMLTLESFDASGATHVALGTDIVRLAHASYAAELVDEAVRPATGRAGGLRLAGRDAGAAGRRRGDAPNGCGCSRWGCLRALGFQPVVDRCAACGTTDPAAPFRWDPDRGGALCAAARAAAAPSRRRPGPRWSVWHACRWPKPTPSRWPPDVNRGCREALSEIINQHISGPLKSLEFIAKLPA